MKEKTSEGRGERRSEIEKEKTQERGIVCKKQGECGRERECAHERVSARA